jgi:hypothetical protein
MSEHHTILGGKVHVYKRPNSSSWQCATYLAGKNRRTTTKEDTSRRRRSSLKTGTCSCEASSAPAS